VNVGPRRRGLPCANPTRSSSSTSIGRANRLSRGPKKKLYKGRVTRSCPGCRPRSMWTSGGAGRPFLYVRRLTAPSSTQPSSTRNGNCQTRGLPRRGLPAANRGRAGRRGPAYVSVVLCEGSARHQGAARINVAHLAPPAAIMVLMPWVSRPFHCRHRGRSRAAPALRAIRGEACARASSSSSLRPFSTAVPKPKSGGHRLSERLWVRQSRSRGPRVESATGRRWSTPSRRCTHLRVLRDMAAHETKMTSSTIPTQTEKKKKETPTRNAVPFRQRSWPLPRPAHQLLHHPRPMCRRAQNRVTRSRRALRRKVWAEVGRHYRSSNQAMPLTAVDVNTGRATPAPRAQPEKRILKTTSKRGARSFTACASATSADPHPDLIDMETAGNRDKGVPRAVRGAAETRPSTTSPQDLPPSSGLVEIRRKRTRESPSSSISARPAPPAKQSTCSSPPPARRISNRTSPRSAEGRDLSSRRDLAHPCAPVGLRDTAQRRRGCAGEEPARSIGPRSAGRGPCRTYHPSSKPDHLGGRARFDCSPAHRRP